MEFIETTLKGCYEVLPRIFNDARGNFVKTFNASDYKKAGLRTDWKEDYYSVSQKNVVRGMHFQVPPYEHAKLVTCLKGEIRDVVLDLRKSSPTFGQYYSIILSSKRANCIYVPEGLAHGFMSLTQDALVLYKVTSEYHFTSDGGILWSSIGYDWDINEPVVSERDSAFPTMNDFSSPFL